MGFYPSDNTFILFISEQILQAVTKTETLQFTKFRHQRYKRTYEAVVFLDLLRT